MKRILKWNQRSRQSGSVFLTVLVGLTALLGLTSLAIDVGVAYNSRTQAQAAVDATALAAAQTMIDSSSGDVTMASSQTAAVGIAAQNSAYPNPSLVLDLGDLVYGDWDLDSRTLDTAIDLTDPDQLTAVEAGFPNKSRDQGLGAPQELGRGLSHPFGRGVFGNHSVGVVGAEL